MLKNILVKISHCVFGTGLIETNSINLYHFEGRKLKGGLTEEFSTATLFSKNYVQYYRYT